MRDDFAIFILSHGRPDVQTLKTIQEQCNYTGKWYIFVDDEDDKYPDYVKNYGEEHIIYFNKSSMVGTFDLFDNFEQRNTVNFARNMCFRKARELGLNYFAEFDDDYGEFEYRYRDDDKLRAFKVRNFDELCEAYIEFLENTPCRCIAFAQTGEMQGGISGATWAKHIKRKSMNTFFFRVTDNPEEDVWFIGRMNDDVNTYVAGGMRGELWYQNARINVDQGTTQANASGLTDMYLQFGTFNKSFYTVMLSPSSVKVHLLGEGHPRFHHSIKWENTVPKLLSEQYKKK